MSLITTILAIFSSIFKFGMSVFDYIKSAELISQGKNEQQSDLAKEEIEINRKQTEILSQEVTKEETVKKLEEGTFKIHGIVNTQKGLYPWKNTGSYICGLIEKKDDTILAGTGGIFLMVIFLLLK